MRDAGWERFRQQPRSSFFPLLCAKVLLRIARHDRKMLVERGETAAILDLEFRVPGCAFSQAPGPMLQRLPDNIGDLRHLIDAHERVHLGQQPGQLIAKPLGQTT